MWLIVRRSSCTWLVDTNNILINDELCTPYVCITKREAQEEKRKEKTEIKRMGGRSRPSQRSVRSTFERLFVRYVSYRCTCTRYGLIAQLADHRYENFRLDEINDDDRLTTDMWGWIWGFASIIWPIVPNYYSMQVYVPELSIRSASQPVSQSANHIGWNDRISLITLSNNADSPQSQWTLYRKRGAGLEFIKCYFTEGSVIYELRLVVLDDSMRS